jgi:hypothetical protein
MSIQLNKEWAMPAATDETIGTATAARLIGVSEGRIRQLANAGILPVIATPLGRTYRLSDVAALVARREREQRERRRP